MCELMDRIGYIRRTKDDLTFQNVTGRAKTRHICTNYTCSENPTFLNLCL